MLACRTCGAGVDATLTSCLACGSEVPLGQFGALLGLICVRCEAYNDPGSRRCVACDAPLGQAANADLGAQLEALQAGAPEGVAPADEVSLTPTPLPFAAPAATSPPPVPGAAPPPGAPPLPGVPRGSPLAPSAAPHLPPAATPPDAPPPPQPALAPPLRTPAESPGGTRAPAPPFAATEAASQGAVQLSIRLHVERGASQVGTVFQLTGQSTRIGGTDGEVRFPEDPCLAPVHATLAVREGALVLRDEGSETGVYVRLRGLTIPLRPSALFAVGDRLLCFRGPLPPGPPRTGRTQRLGSPRPSAAAVLVEERLEGGTTGRAYVRSGPSVTLGRAGCSINLGDDPFVSQTHAELVVEADGGARLRDLGSSNGTFARLPSGAERELQDGDRLRLGREVLRVEIG